MESWCIGINSFGLDIWAIFATMTNTLIWYKPKDIMCIENAIYSSLYKTSPISILYTDDVLSPIMVCPEVTVECSAEGSYMDITSWGWCETGTDSHGEVKSKK
jgi:hypothetical protein